MLKFILLLVFLTVAIEHGMVHSRRSKLHYAWQSDTQLAWIEKENIVILDVRTNTTQAHPHSSILLSSGKQRSLPIFSNNQNYYLVKEEKKSIWLNSYTARYSLTNTKTGKSHQIKAKYGEDHLHLCKFGNIEDSRLSLVYVTGNNLYWRVDGTFDDPSRDIQVTSDGVPGIVFNGITDWIYEEMGFLSASAFFVQNKKIAYAKINDSEVPEFKFPHYGNPEEIQNNKYPEYKVIRYPKVGAPNPITKGFVFDKNANFTKEVIPPPEVMKWSEHIMDGMEWMSDEMLRLQWFNRFVNESVLALCTEEPIAWHCRTIFTETQPNGWLMGNGMSYASGRDPNLLMQEDHILRILPSLQSDTGRHYKHIAKSDLLNRTQPMFLTRGVMVVFRILSWTDGIVKFSASEIGKPWSTHLYQVPDDGSQGVECITCSTKTSHGDFCETHYVDFPFGNHSMYLEVCEAKGDADIVLKKTGDNSVIEILRTAKKPFDKEKGSFYTKVELPDDFSALVYVELPEGFNTTQKYPVVVEVYGGPSSKSVVAGYLWKSKHGKIESLVESYVGAALDSDSDTEAKIRIMIDGRGTEGQSDEHMYTVYKRLGTVCVEDQIEVTRKLIKKYKFMDKERVGIWGISYGGYMTIMVLEHDSGPDSVFKCGAAVAPVTHWTLYNSFFTEHYMGPYNENTMGYNLSAFTRLENLRNKQLLLQHGVGDDNVHFQHSALLARGLQMAGIQFEQVLHPDEDHYFNNTEKFMFQKINSHFDKCLKFDKNKDEL